MKEHYDVLDHGYVKYQGHLGSEEDIIRAARMSTDKGFLGWGDKHICGDIGYREPGEFPNPRLPNCLMCKEERGDEKLLEYLYKNHHMTPFEMLELRVEVKAPIMVFREWHRHRTFSYNEMSGRYIQIPDEHYKPHQVRYQDKKNKQGSVDRIDFREIEKTGQAVIDFYGNLKRDQINIYEAYEDAIEAGIAKEVARINTPISRYSKMWAKANLRNWLHFLNLRLRSNAQMEIRLYAEAVRSIIDDLWPRTYALFEEYTLAATMLSETQTKRLLQTISEDKLKFILEGEK